MKDSFTGDYSNKVVRGEIQPTYNVNNKKSCPKCGIPIEDHPADACLDALFAEKVMKWKVIWHDCQQEPECGEWEAHIWSKSGWYETKNLPCYKDKYGYLKVVPFYSTNISHAMEGVEKRRRSGIAIKNWWFEMDIRPNGWRVNVTGFKQDNIYAETAPLAITRALIMWAMEEEDAQNQTQNTQEVQVSTDGEISD